MVLGNYALQKKLKYAQRRMPNARAMSNAYAWRVYAENKRVLDRARTFQRRVDPATQRYVKKMINYGKDLKHHTTYFSSTVNWHTLHTHYVAGNITQGTNDHERIGDSVFMRGLRLELYTKNTAQNLIGHCRVVFVRDKIPSSDPADRFFEDNANADAPEKFDSLVSSHPRFLINRVNSNRYQVLFDKTYRLGLNDLTNKFDLSSNQFAALWFPIGRRIKVDEYPGVGGGIQPAYRLFIFFEKDQPSGLNSDSPPDLYYHAKEYFTDS